MCLISFSECSRLCIRPMSADLSLWGTLTVFSYLFLRIFNFKCEFNASYQNILFQNVFSVLWETNTGRSIIVDFFSFSKYISNLPMWTLSYDHSFVQYYQHQPMYCWYPFIFLGCLSFFIDDLWPNCGLYTVGCELWPVNCGLLVVTYKLWPINYDLWTLVCAMLPTPTIPIVFLGCLSTDGASKEIAEDYFCCCRVGLVAIVHCCCCSQNVDALCSVIPVN